MKTHNLQLTLQDLDDIKFALEIAADVAKDYDEDKLSKYLLNIHDRIVAHLEHYNIPDRI